MTVPQAVKDILLAADCICTESVHMGLVFCGPVGRGWIDATGSCLRIRHDVSAVTDDPIALVRISSQIGPARIALRHRTPVAERTCTLDELHAVLMAMASMVHPGARRALPCVDVTVGVLGIESPTLEAAAFLRLAPPVGTVIDAARATYLLAANVRLRSAAGAWIDGPGLVVDPQRSDRTVLAQELFEVGAALRELADDMIARSYLDLCGMRPQRTKPFRPARDAAPGPQPKEDHHEFSRNCGAPDRAL
jgi:hypothetical protein